jgi:hypothetical protein
MEEFLTEFSILHNALCMARKNEEQLRESNAQLQVYLQSEKTSALRATSTAREAQNIVKEMKEVCMQ